MSLIDARNMATEFEEAKQKELDAISYEDFCKMLAKPGEVLDKEITNNEEGLLAKTCNISLMAANAAYAISPKDFPERLNILATIHMAIGLIGEAGELMDAIKNVVIYRKNITNVKDGKRICDNVIEEIGDLCFYGTEYTRLTEDIHVVNIFEVLEKFLDQYNRMYPEHAFTIEDAKKHNKNKLSKRYHKLAYSDSQAHERADKNVS